MDLALLDTADLANQGAVMHVHSPLGPVWVEDEQGKPTDEPVTITLLGDDSEIMTKWDRDAFNEGMRSPGVVNADQIEARAINRLVAATVGWSGLVYEGSPLPFTKDNARMIYRKIRWLRAGAQRFVSDRSNFLRASPTA
jgi:hypothetical protein